MKKKVEHSTNKNVSFKIRQEINVEIEQIVLYI